jgi:peptide/nickel transport system substrate-binding protein
MRKFFVVLSFLMVASMLLSACGAPAPTAAPATQAPATAAPATAAPATAAPATTAPTAAGPKSKDPTTLTVADMDVSIDTLDPALAYDTASAEIIQSVYDTLIFYDGTKLDTFVPLLADSWTISPDGKTYTFKIKTGVKFHNGDVLTPDDVAFSFQRGLLQAGSASPQWLLSEPFFGIGLQDISSVIDPSGALQDDREGLSKVDPAKLKAACEQVQNAIVADDTANTVTMTLAQPWGPFLATVAQSWGSIMDKKWVADNKGWDGSCDTWQNFYGMVSADDPFSAIENGTGPFTLTSLKQGEQYTMDAFADYFRGAPKLQHIIDKAVGEWGTRFAMMQAGDADIAVVPPANRSQMDALVGEKCVYDTSISDYGPCEVTDATKPFRVYLGLPPISQDVILFNFAIATSDKSPNPYIGSGKLDGNGVPPDFFSDVNIRKGFAYCFDWDTFINDVYTGEAVQSISLELPGMPGYFTDTPHYTLDLDKCAAAFQASTLKSADGKSVWDVGFRVQMLFNQGNTTRQTLAQILATNLNSVNSKFDVEILGIPWAAYLTAQRAHQIPIMTGGWLEDIHDPHNWLQPYTSSVGAYSGREGLPASLTDQFDKILSEGVAETDPVKRGEIYKQANQLYYDQAVGVPIVLATGHGFRQRWVHGEILNPIFPGVHYYEMYKD